MNLYVLNTRNWSLAHLSQKVAADYLQNLTVGNWKDGVRAREVALACVSEDAIIAAAEEVRKGLLEPVAILIRARELEALTIK